METLREALEKYKEITVKIHKLVENDDYDSLNDLFYERQVEINKMSSMSYTKEEFSKICEELDLVNLEKQLEIKMTENRNKLKKEISEFEGTKNASRSYSKRNAVDAIFFNKKIY